MVDIGLYHILIFYIFRESLKVKINKSCRGLDNLIKAQGYKLPDPNPNWKHIINLSRSFESAPLSRK